ncbi:MAG: hypothetical protein K8R92_03425 [Planctomycetes bacterium]|nr:hypothetical protein [Planctomycetota bacterium]
MSALQRSFTSALFIASATCSAMAEDLLPAPWRGAPQTTYQQWDFSGGPLGGAPEVLPYFNPYGTPILGTTGSPVWLPFSFGSSGETPRLDQWQVTYGSALSVDNKNVPDDLKLNSSAGFMPGCKFADVAVTYFGDDPVVTILPQSGHGDFSVVLDGVTKIALPDGWTFARYDFTFFAPIHPSAETFLITASPGGMVTIDGIVVETHVPGSSVCEGDLDGSGAVDGGDVGLMLLDFGPCPGCISDLDGSGEVDGADVGLMLLNFGDCPSAAS